MILFTYDQGGVYVGPVSPRLSPARPFVDGKPNYLRPARSTDQQPPECPPGFVPVFNGTAWEQVEDHRGAIAYSTATGSGARVTSVGPLREGWTLTPKPGDDYSWGGDKWAFDSQLALENVRAKRNALLYSCDWTQLPDSPLDNAQKVSWATYRQALRDYTDGWTPEKQWPTPPGE